jgi:hypothetical protein
MPADPLPAFTRATGSPAPHSQIVAGTGDLLIDDASLKNGV